MNMEYSQQTIDASLPFQQTTSPLLDTRIDFGRDNAMLVMDQGDENSKRWFLSRSRPLTIGRSENCDITLVDRQVSRFHARVSWNGKFYQLEDLGSKNGTHLNGKESRTAMILNDGDEFQIGVRFKLAFVDDGATAPLTLDDSVKGLTLEKGSRTVRIGGQELNPPLSLPQYMLLDLLWNAHGGVVTRNQIVDAVWPEDSFDGISEQAIDALVRRLRERIAELDPHNAYVVTVRGHGFRLNNMAPTFA
ncbi:FHA domain-containing protein [Chloroflexi bacterium TSY]|nr:FHA domain-containing protein [Chloroflexi bacterium TSY]